MENGKLVSLWVIPGLNWGHMGDRKWLYWDKDNGNYYNILGVP